MLRYFTRPGALFLVLLPLRLSWAQDARDPVLPPPLETQVPDAGSPDLQQLPAPQPPKRPLVRRFLHDEYRMWTAPFRSSNYDSHSMKKYGVPLLVISAGAIATDRKTAELLPNTPDQEIWSGRVSQVGTSYTLAGFAGTMFLIGKAKSDNHLREAGSLGLQALAHSHLIARGLKQITQRERPSVDKQRTGFWRGGKSFPSGHASNSFAVATVFAYEYRHHIAIPIAAYSVATLVSASRVSARQHWFSDIFAGGTLGFMIGRYVYKQHHDPSLPGSPVDRKSQAVPEVGIVPGGILLYWHF